MTNYGGFAEPERDTLDRLEDILNSRWEDLERKKVVMHVRFPGDRLAWIAPDDYPPKQDCPVFTYSEISGLVKHGGAKMFDVMYNVKMVFCNARAESIRIKTVAGGFYMPED